MWVLLRLMIWSQENNISTDQYECQVKGRLHHTRGREDPQYMFSGGTIFVDHATWMLSVYHQVSLDVTDTTRSKELYKLSALLVGITIKGY